MPKSHEPRAPARHYRPTSKTYQELSRALVRAGLPASVIRRVKGCNLETVGAVEILVNTRIDAAPYARILLDYASKLTTPNEIEMVARCMTQSKGFQDAVPWLLSLFEAYPENGFNETHLWAIGQAIYTINNKQFYPEVISICRTKKYGHGRQMLMGTLARARTDEAYEVLLDCLEDATVRAHAIEAIGRFGCTDAIAILEPLEVQKGLYEFKSKQTALRRLRRRQGKTSL
jgi:hypothetical protein